jgi:hypothetical protein
MEKQPDLIHCGFVNDLKVGVAEHNSGVGLLMEFSPALNLPRMAMILAPGQAVALRKTLQRLERDFGWTENSKPPLIPPEMVNPMPKR